MKMCIESEEIKQVNINLCLESACMTLIVNLLNSTNLISRLMILNQENLINIILSRISSSFSMRTSCSLNIWISFNLVNDFCYIDDFRNSWLFKDKIYINILNQLNFSSCWASKFQAVEITESEWLLSSESLFILSVKITLQKTSQIDNKCFWKHFSTEDFCSDWICSIIIKKWNSDSVC